jgi:hypothetical protein
MGLDPTPIPSTTMSDATEKYEVLIATLLDQPGITQSQMFGKACLKKDGKAFIAQHKDVVIFKLSGTAHEAALAIEGAALWDPSGKGRPMKAWVAVPASQSRHFKKLAEAARQG